MTLNINSLGNNYNLLINSISTPRKAFTASNVQTGISDTFTPASELNPYLSESAIRQMILMNPQVVKILKNNGLKAEINIKELQKLAEGHLLWTKNIAAGIIGNLPLDIQKQINRQAVLQAAIFHDFGKVLIPNKIINKKSALNDKEKQIMKLHSELGYELLKTQKLSPETLELIKYHHQTPENTGYPINNTGFTYGLEAEILAVADKYSALIEKRSYKPALSKKEALEIIKQDYPQGGLVYDALVNYAGI